MCLPLVRRQLGEIESNKESDFVGIFDLIMTPLYYLVSGVLVLWHMLFTDVLGMDPDGGAAWVLSIIGLTLVIRAALIPLFVKQIKSSRNMQLIQPRVKELQKKYGHDRQKFAEESMKLYKEAGTNPFASCLPILIQMPIFFALFRTLSDAAKDKAHGFLNEDLARSFGESQLFDSIPLRATFWGSRPGAEDPNGLVMVVAAILVIAMIATTFFTQRQLMAKNMPADAMTGPYAQQQKMLLYVLPFIFGISGVAFPIGVVLYWTTSNIWTMGQQFYVIRNNPAPGTEAARAKEERDRAKAKKKGLPEPTESDDTEVARAEAERRLAQRQQPKRQTRSQRKGGAGSPNKPVANKPATSKGPTNKPKPPGSGAKSSNRKGDKS